MKTVHCAVLCVASLVVQVTAWPVNYDQHRTDRAKQELLDLEKHWLTVENNPGALESILAPDFLHVVPAGIITKSEQLDFMRKHPATWQAPQKHLMRTSQFRSIPASIAPKACLLQTAGEGSPIWVFILASRFQYCCFRSLRQRREKSCVLYPLSLWATMTKRSQPECQPKVITLLTTCEGFTQPPKTVKSL